MAEYNVVTKDVEYIPQWDGNRDRPDPIRVTLRYLTNAERARCFGIRTNGRGGTEVEPDNEQLIKLGVVRIDGFVVNKKPIATAAQFSALQGFDALYLEIATQVLTMNAREDITPLS